LNEFRFKGGCALTEERGSKRIRNLLSRWLTLPPEALFFQ